MLTNLCHYVIVAGMANEPWPVHTLWPDLEAGPWRITIWWRAQHGTAVPVGVAMRSWVDDPDSFLTEFKDLLPTPGADVEFPAVGSQLVRSLPIGQLLDESRSKLLEHLADLARPADLPEGWEAWQTAMNEAAEEFRASVASDLDSLSAKRGGRDLGDAHYREVAEVYKAAVRHGQPPRKTVATHFTVSDSSAAKKIARARDRGFLPPTTRGRVGRPTQEL